VAQVPQPLVRRLPTSRFRFPVVQRRICRLVARVQKQMQLLF
jgi:hypothetical protein